MSVVLVTGSSGLVGSEAVAHYAAQGRHIVGIDNDMRRVFFGEEASTLPTRERVRRQTPNYEHFDIDVRDGTAIDAIFRRFGRDIDIVIHTAAQPSHDWAARDPVTDFTVNANGTLVLLEHARRTCPHAVFIFCST